MKLFGDRKIFGMSQREVLVAMVIGVVGAVGAIIAFDRWRDSVMSPHSFIQKQAAERAEQRRMQATSRPATRSR